MDISNFLENKKYYFYNTFSYEKKPAYKLCESFESADLFDFKDFDGYLNYDKNKIIEFNNKDKKYKYLVLYFEGDNFKTMTPIQKMEYYDEETLSKFFFAILENYEILRFNPFIPIVIYAISLIIVTILSYCLFQCDRKPKVKKLGEINVNSLIEN